MKIKYFFLLLIVSLFNLCEAHVFDHLKDIEQKSDGHSMRNIDFIYMINLDDRPEKFKMSLDQLKPYGISPFRFSAIYGWKLSLEEINDIGVKYHKGMDCGFNATSYLTKDLKPHHQKIQTPNQTYFCHCLSRGAIGIVLSHLSVLKDAYQSDYETIWVMEDDIDVLADPRVIPDLIDKLDNLVGKEGWDILFTDRDIRNSEGGYNPARGYARRPNFKVKDKARLCVNQPISPEFRLLGARFGATSMIIRRSGIEKILNFYKKYGVYHPYDMDYHVPEGMRMFTVLKDIISNKTDAISDNGKFKLKK